MFSRNLNSSYLGPLTPDPEGVRRYNSLQFFGKPLRTIGEFEADIAAMIRNEWGTFYDHFKKELSFHEPALILGFATYPHQQITSNLIHSHIGLAELLDAFVKLKPNALTKDPVKTARIFGECNNFAAIIAALPPYDAATDNDSETTCDDVFELTLPDADAAPKEDTSTTHSFSS